MTKRTLTLALGVVALASTLAVSAPPHSTHAQLSQLVKTAAMALQQYAADHNGQLPATLHVLNPNYTTSLVWHVQGVPLPIITDTNSTYRIPSTPITLIYVPRDQILGMTDAPTHLIAFTSRQDEEGLRLAITKDFRVVNCTEEYFQQMIIGGSASTTETIKVKIE